MMDIPLPWVLSIDSGLRYLPYETGLNQLQGKTMNRVDNKVALVTGGGSGLGEASSIMLAKEGASVVVTDVDGDAARRTEEAILQQGGQAISLEQNVVDEKRWKEVMDLTIDKFGQLDVLVNNAGVSGANTGIFEETTLDQWRMVMQINLDAVFLGTQKAVQVMKDKGGSIINISSIMGIVGGAGAAYNASKGGVRLLTKSVAAYCGLNGYKIRVNSIHPGYIWTPMVRNVLPYVEDLETEEQLKAFLTEKHPIGRLGEPDDIAKGVLFLASDDSCFMTGSELVIDGGYTAV